jgi:hypothetical protein
LKEGRGCWFQTLGNSRFLINRNESAGNEDSCQLRIHK